MLKKIFLLVAANLFLLAQVKSDSLKEKDYDITRYGAKSNSEVLNTKAIQKTIDAAADAGGGKVIVPEGTFLTGSVILKSNVELHIQKGGTLLGSTKVEDYTRLKRRMALILADHQENISITGEGVIDGQGRELALYIDSLFYVGKLEPRLYNRSRKRPNEGARPEIIEMVKCKNIQIKGVTIKDGACWLQTYDRCEDLVMDSIRVESDAYWNNDGIDVSDCKNVRITNSYVNSADDGICLKSHTEGCWNDNIHIENCTVRSSANAVKFGTVSRGGFKNVVIKNIRVFDTFRSAIAIESVDGGCLENVLVDGINATNTGNAILVRLGHRNKGEEGTLRNVTLKNIKVEVPFDRPDKNYELRGPDLSVLHNPIPSSITGIPGHCVENVTLENIEIIFPGRGNKGMAIIPLDRLDDVPEQETAYPEFSMFGELPAWGFYVRHVKGLKMKNVSVKAMAKDFRPAFVFDDVNGLNLQDIDVQGGENMPHIILKDVKVEYLSVDKKLLQQ